MSERAVTEVIEFFAAKPASEWVRISEITIEGLAGADLNAALVEMWECDMVEPLHDPLRSRVLFRREPGPMINEETAELFRRTF